MKKYSRSTKVSAVEITGDTITGRGGLTLFARYIGSVGILKILSSRFGHLRKSSKGTGLEALFTQILCWLMDGTSRHLSYFDQLMRDVSEYRDDEWRIYENPRQAWEYIEFDWGCDNWADYYRTFYTRPIYEDGQRLLEFARPDNVIITTLDYDTELLKDLSAAERKLWSSPSRIIASHHGRGADELPHRGLKDFGFEALPFKRFGPNAAVYYCMLIAFFLFEAFKRDTLDGVIPIESYATTVRRRVIDIAAKFVSTGGRVILKVMRATMDALQFDLLWERCKSPPPIEV